MKTNSISEKLILYFVGFGIVVIMVIGSYSYHTAKKALLNRTFDQLISLRLEKKNQIEQFFHDRDRELNLLAKSSEIKQLTNLFCSNIKTDNINSNLSSYISSFGYSQRLYIADNNGRIIDIDSIQSRQQNNTNNVSDKILKHFCNEVRTKQKTIIEDISNSKFLIHIGTPIFDEEKKCIGALILVIPVAAINKLMVAYSTNDALSQTIESYLVGDDYLMRSNSRFKEDAVYRIKVKSASVVNALKGETGFQIVNDYRNIPCLSSYSKISIDGLNWVILAELDEQEALIPVYSIRNSIILISLIAAISVFIFTFIISKKITSPLKNLEKASKQIGTGNYDIHLKVSSLDEIGLLTDTFNNMVVQLKKQNEELEEEKKKRVRSLIDGQDMERQRLSRDLHDSLGQSILAVKMKLEQINDAKTEGNNKVILDTQELLKTTIHEIRNISNDLMPKVLEAFGIELGLKNLCKETNENTGLIIQYFSKDIPSLSKKTQIYIYRITQEAINNIIKHSGTKEAEINISSYQNLIFLKISDKGKGFDITKTNLKGNGINNIKERVELLNGEYEVHSIIGRGTTINIKIPITDL